MTVVPEHFPYVIRQQGFTLTVQSVKVIIEPKLGKAAPAGTTISVCTDSAGTTPLATQTLLQRVPSQDLFLQQVSKNPPQAVTPLVLDDVEDIVLEFNYTVA
jgi:hypothetical protein